MLFRMLSRWEARTRLIASSLCTLSRRRPPRYRPRRTATPTCARACCSTSFPPAFTPPSSGSVRASAHCCRLGTRTSSRSILWWRRSPTCTTAGTTCGRILTNHCTMALGSSSSRSPSAAAAISCFGRSRGTKRAAATTPSLCRHATRGFDASVPEWALQARPPVQAACVATLCGNPLRGDLVRRCPCDGEMRGRPLPCV